MGLVCSPFKRECGLNSPGAAAAVPASVLSTTPADCRHPTPGGLSKCRGCYLRRKTLRAPIAAHPVASKANAVGSGTLLLPSLMRV